MASHLIRECLNGREEDKLVIPEQVQGYWPAQILSKPVLPLAVLTLVLGFLPAAPSPSLSCPSPQALQSGRWSGGRRSAANHILNSPRPLHLVQPTPFEQTAHSASASSFPPYSAQQQQKGGLRRRGRPC